METNRSVGRLRELLQSLDIADEEHSDVDLKHETEWCLSAFPSSLLVWENIEAAEGAPRHLTNAPREKILNLWIRGTALLS